MGELGVLLVAVVCFCFGVFLGCRRATELEEVIAIKDKSIADLEAIWQGRHEKATALWEQRDAERVNHANELTAIIERWKNEYDALAKLMEQR